MPGNFRVIDPSVKSDAINDVKMGVCLYLRQLLNTK
jgi:hypothetical protein